jgi:hypothetical protein
LFLPCPWPGWETKYAIPCTREREAKTTVFWESSSGYCHKLLYPKPPLRNASSLEIHRRWIHTMLSI